MFLSDSLILKDNILNDVTDERKFQELIEDIALKRVLKSFNSNDNKKKSQNEINEIYYSSELSVIHFGIIIFNKKMN